MAISVDLIVKRSASIRLAVVAFVTRGLVTEDEQVLGDLVERR